MTMVQCQQRLKRHLLLIFYFSVIVIDNDVWSFVVLVAVGKTRTKSLSRRLRPKTFLDFSACTLDRRRCWRSSTSSLLSRPPSMAGDPAQQQQQKEHAKLDVSLPPPPPLTILIPAYNEALRIQETLQNYTTYLEKRQQKQEQQKTSSNEEKLSSAPWNSIGRTCILVVDDGSTDDTRAVVEKFASSSVLERVTAR
jgi:Glycosyl transferase family 2